MTEANPKIVILRDYAKAREVLNDKDIEMLLLDQRTNLRKLDTYVNDLLFKKHKLKDAQYLKDKAMIVERNLVDISDLLEDKIATSKNDEERNAKQAFLKQYEQLIARNERIKKNLSDDITACRYIETKEALDPLKILGSIVGSSVAGGTLARLVTDKSSTILHAAEAGAAISTLISFHQPIRKAWKSASEMVISVPRQIRNSYTVYYLKTNGRNTTFAMAWAFSVYAKRSSKIESRQPIRNKANIWQSTPIAKMKNN